jgi:hypothetical protein
MSGYNLPEYLTQRDIDALCGPDNDEDLDETDGYDPAEPWMENL